MDCRVLEKVPLQGLDALFERLNAHFSRHKAFSEAEIAIIVSVEIAQLSEKERRKLESELGEDLEHALMTSIIVEPMSAFLPVLNGRKNYLGEVFYHRATHEFLSDELEKAFKRLAIIKGLSNAEAIDRVVTDFLHRSGYEVRQETPVKSEPGIHRMAASRDSKLLSVVFLPSILFASACATDMVEDRDYVLVVPTEKTPAPFIDFKRDRADIFRSKKVQIWVVNTEKGTVNLFRGRTDDIDIYNNFDIPVQSPSVPGIFEEDDF